MRWTWVGALLTTTLCLAHCSGEVDVQATRPRVSSSALVRRVPSQFSTIQAAIDAASPGDTVLVAEGVYREMLTVNKTDLTIQAEDPFHPPVLDGSDPDFQPTWTHVEGSIYRTTYAWGGRSHPTPADYNTFSGGDAWRYTPIQLYEDGELLKGYTGPRAAGRPLATNAELDPDSTAGVVSFTSCDQNVHHAGHFRWDPAADQLYVWTKDSDSPANHSYAIPNPTRLNLALVQAAGVTLRNLVFQYSPGWAVVVTGDRATVDHNFLVDNHYPIQARSVSGLTISHNFIRDYGHWKHYNYDDGKSTVMGGYAIETTGHEETTDVAIFGNVISEFYTCLNTSSIRTQVYNNICARTSSVAMNTSDTSQHDQSVAYDLNVHHNIIHHSCEGAMACSFVTIGPLNFYRNVIYNTGDFAKDGTGVAGGRSGMCRLYQNTTALIRNTLGDKYAFPVEKHTVLRNNLFHFRGTNARYWVYRDNALEDGWAYFPFTSGPDSDFNLFWQTTYPMNTTQAVASFTNLGGAGRSYTPSQFARMTEETGLDTHGFQADPLFVNGTAITQAVRSTFDAEGEVERLSMANHLDLIARGFDEAFAEQFTAAWNYFAVLPNSPARGAGTALPLDWPDTEPRVAAPDLGAGPAPMLGPVSSGSSSLGALSLSTGASSVVSSGFAVWSSSAEGSSFASSGAAVGVTSSGQALASSRVGMSSTARAGESSSAVQVGGSTASSAASGSPADNGGGGPITPGCGGCGASAPTDGVVLWCCAWVGRRFRRAAQTT